MSAMKNLRNLTQSEIASLTAMGTTAEDWNTIYVSNDFSTTQIIASRLCGEVHIGSHSRIIHSLVRNYSLEEDVLVESVAALECRHQSSFGNGTGVSTMNECGGRTVKIFYGMSLQIAYLSAIYRHRPQLMAAIDKISDDVALRNQSHIGRVGRGSHITGARFVREVNIGERATIDGTSVLQNGTIGDDVFIGVDVKAYDFIIDCGSRIDNGVILERCFVGESCVMDKGFTSADSLFFANSHCENGEAAAIFAGPYTVSHHKSSLLIAGMFSFFNAGSGSNQSNHLFKSGAVHQSVHLRGCKFSSGAYIMSPAIEAPFTMVMGHHTHHHDTRIFPYSYLIESDSKSVLMPAANLTSYGTVRDIDKWRKRDRRKVCRDVVSFDEFNPYITELMLRGVDTLTRIMNDAPNEEFYTYNKTVIKPAHLRRGILLYNKAIVAAIGEMLRCGESSEQYDGRGTWIDLGGQYINKSYVDTLLCEIEQQQITTAEEIDSRLHSFAAHYDDYAHSWALDTLAGILGHHPEEQDIRDAISASESVQRSFKEMTESDRLRDCSLDMAVSYGLGGDSDEETRDDYFAVRGLN